MRHQYVRCVCSGARQTKNILNNNNNHIVYIKQVHMCIFSATIYHLSYVRNAVGGPSSTCAFRVGVA